MTANTTTPTETEALRLYRQCVAAEDALNQIADEDERDAALRGVDRLANELLAAPITCPADLAAMVATCATGSFTMPGLMGALDAKLRDLLKGEAFSEVYEDEMRMATNARRDAA